MRLRATKGRLKVHGAHANRRTDLLHENVNSKTIENTSWKCELKNCRGYFPWKRAGVFKNRRKDFFKLKKNSHSSTV